MKLTIKELKAAAALGRKQARACDRAGDRVNAKLLREEAARFEAKIAAVRHKNPLSESHGHVPDVYPEGWYMDIGSATDLRKVRDAIRAIDSAQTRPELYAAYHRACDVARKTRGVGSPLLNDIGFSYTQRLSEIPLTPEEAAEAARDAGAKATAAWAKSYKYKPSRRRNPDDGKGRFVLPLDLYDLNGPALLQIVDRLPPTAARKYQALRETGLNVRSAALNVIVSYEGKRLHPLNAQHIRNPSAKADFKVAFRAHRAWATRRIPYAEYDAAIRPLSRATSAAEESHKSRRWKLDTPKRLAWKPTTKGFSAYLGSGTSVDVEPNTHLSWGPAGWVAVIDKYGGGIPKFIDRDTHQAKYGTHPGHYVYPTAKAAQQGAAKYHLLRGKRDRSLAGKLPGSRAR